MRRVKAIEQLEQASSALEGLVGRSTRCALPDEVKESVRIYVDTWIIPQIRSALLEVKEECLCSHRKSGHKHGLYSCSEPDCDCYSFRT